MAKMKIKNGDQVVVIAGKDKGKRGEVLAAMPQEHKVVVSGVAVAKKHQKAAGPNQQGGIVEKEAKIDVSNVALVDPTGDKATRVGYKFLDDGTKVRFAKKSGEVIK